MNAHPNAEHFIVSPRNTAWVGVGLDGVLAHALSPRSKVSIGPPVPQMIDRVRQWIAQGRVVKIFTPRVAVPGEDADRARQEIAEWLVARGLPPLECTCVRDAFCIELWDANVVQTIPNTGSRVDRR